MTAPFETDGAAHDGPHGDLVGARKAPLDVSSAPPVSGGDSEGVEATARLVAAPARCAAPVASILVACDVDGVAVLGHHGLSVDPSKPKVGVVRVREAPDQAAVGGVQGQDAAIPVAHVDHVAVQGHAGPALGAEVAGAARGEQERGDGQQQPSGAGGRCVGHGVVAAPAPGVAAGQASEHEPGPHAQAVTLDGLVGVLRAGRIVPALPPEVRRDGLLVEADERQGPAFHRPSWGAAGPGFARSLALLSTPCSPCRSSAKAAVAASWRAEMTMSQPGVTSVCLSISPQAASDAVADNCVSHSLANRKAEPGVFPVVPSGSHHQEA